MKRHFVKQPINAAITSNGKIKQFAKMLSQGVDLTETDAFLKWCGRKVIPDALLEADAHYCYRGGQLRAEEMEYNENWNESNHYLCIDDGYDSSVYILNVQDEIDTIISCLTKCKNYDQLLSSVASQLYIFDEDEDEDEITSSDVILGASIEDYRGYEIHEEGPGEFAIYPSEIDEEDPEARPIAFAASYEDAVRCIDEMIEEEQATSRPLSDTEEMYYLEQEARAEAQRDSIKRYTYTGPVYKYDRYIGDVKDLETRAKNKMTAISNLIYQASKKCGLPLGLANIDEEKVKEH